MIYFRYIIVLHVKSLRHKSDLKWLTTVMVDDMSAERKR